MSDKILNTVKAFIYKQSKSNGINTNNPDTGFEIDMQRGKRAKRVIDAVKTNQNYFRTKDIQTSLLNHYENVDWYERDSQFDFIPYEERM